jgi:hypothetical protein
MKSTKDNLFIMFTTIFYSLPIIALSLSFSSLFMFKQNTKNAYVVLATLFIGSSLLIF